MALDVGVDRHRLNVGFLAGAYDPDCDFTPVGDEDFIDQATPIV
jgi:hypothetical protein